MSGRGQEFLYLIRAWPLSRIALLEELPLKQAVALAVKITGGSRNELYQRALEMKNEEVQE